MLQEAIASTAASHYYHCQCIICLAAYGDEEAFVEIALSAQAAKDMSGPLIPADIPQNFTLGD